MKWSSLVLVALLALGASCSILEKVKLIEDKPSDLVAPQTKWRSTFYPAGKKIHRKNKALGSATTLEEFRKFFNQASSQKAQAWEEIRSKSGDEHVGKLFRNGITKFTNTATLEHDEGVDMNDVLGYANHVADKFGFQGKRRESFVNEIELASMGRFAETQIISTVFADGKGNGHFVMILVACDFDTNDADYVIIDISAAFEIGPDTFVTVKQKSALFGLIRWSEVQWHSIPATLTKESLELIFNFMKYAALEKFKEFIG